MDETHHAPDAHPSAAPPAPGDPVATIEKNILEAQVIELLRSVYDPEIPVNIYELGMIYDVAVTGTGAVTVQMTLTSPSCPVAGSLPGEVQQRLEDLHGVASAKVDLVWEPPWEPSKMSEAAKLQLGML